MPDLDLRTDDNETENVRDNFEKLDLEFKNHPFLGFEGKVVQADLEAGENDVAHNLGFVPTDVFVTYYDQNSSITHVPNKWTKDRVRVNAPIAGRARLMIGKFGEG